MVLSNGWLVPRSYGGAEGEAEAARTGLALADVSASGKLSLRGRGVSALCETLAPGSPVVKLLGVAWLAGAEPALACRLTEDHLLLLSPGGTPLRPDLHGESVVATDVTSAYAGFLVVGPHTPDLSRRLTHLDVRPAALPVNSCAETQLAGVEALLIPTAEVSLPALRLYVAWDVAECVWERMWEAGHDLSIAALGTDGLRLLADGRSRPVT
jgi:glycine cleavage system aminomethyltransferase T